jgi:serine O-acetyltransferase
LNFISSVEVVLINTALYITYKGYIKIGAKVYGKITIANNSVIAANAAVNKSIVEEGILIAGVPAKPIKSIDIKRIIKHL